MLNLLKSPSQHTPEFKVHHQFHIKSHNKQALNLVSVLEFPPNKWYRLLTLSYKNPAEFPFQYNILSQPNDSAAHCKTKCPVWSLYITPNRNSRLPESFQARFQPEFHIRPDGSVEDLVTAPGQKGWFSPLSGNALFFFSRKVLSSGCLGAFPRQELPKKPKLKVASRKKSSPLMHIGRVSCLVWKTEDFSHFCLLAREQNKPRKCQFRGTVTSTTYNTWKREICFQTTISKAIASAQMDFHPRPVTQTPLQSDSSDSSE